MILMFQNKNFLNKTQSSIQNVMKISVAPMNDYVREKHNLFIIKDTGDMEFGNDTHLIQKRITCLKLCIPVIWSLAMIYSALKVCLHGETFRYTYA